MGGQCLEESQIPFSSFSNYQPIVFGCELSKDLRANAHALAYDGPCATLPTADCENCATYFPVGVMIV